MLSRGGWVLTVLAGASVALLGPDARELADQLHDDSFPGALLALGCLVQLALAAWVLAAVAMSVSHAPAALARAITPQLLRRALFAGTAGALVLAPAHADQAVGPSRPAHHDLTGLQLPDRPVAAPAPAHEPASQATTVLVRPGDTLWAIASRSLPAGATASDIARACAQWHEANRDVIGDDPNLIFPMQRLVPPLGKDPT